MLKEKHPLAWKIGSYIGNFAALIFMSTIMTGVGLYMLALLGLR
jgi:hypothetical protein